VPGVHNILNATAAIAVGIGLDVGVEAIRVALDQFRASTGDSSCAAGGGGECDRRLRAPSYGDQGDVGGSATVRVWPDSCVVPAHRYTRTRDLMDDFATSFADADTLFVLDIYARARAD